MDCGVSAVIVLASIIPAQRRALRARSLQAAEAARSCRKIPGRKWSGCVAARKAQVCGTEGDEWKGRKKRGGLRAMGRGQGMCWSFPLHSVATQNWILCKRKSHCLKSDCISVFQLSALQNSGNSSSSSSGRAAVWRKAEAKSQPNKKRREIYKMDRTHQRASDELAHQRESYGYRIYRRSLFEEYGSSKKETL